MGRSSGITLSGGHSIAYGYDTSGRFNTVSWSINSQSGQSSYSYVPDSDLLYQQTQPNGTQTTYSYEAQRNLKTVVANTYSTTDVSTYDYGHDQLARRTSVINTGTAFAQPAYTRYDYNTRSELIGSQRYLGTDINELLNPVAEQQRAYQYDPIGNRTRAEKAGAATSYTTNGVNQYTGLTGAQTGSLAYDPDGNMITDHNNQSYTYNAENRLVSVQPQSPAEGDSRSEFVYDYMGRRVKKLVYTFSSGTWTQQNEMLFVYDGWNMIKETTIPEGASAVDRYYVWGLDLSQTLQGAGGVGGLLAVIDGSLTYQYLYDANGNVGQVVDAADGSIAAHYEYDPYGKIVNQTGAYADANPYRFSTKYFDSETRLYYYGYRYYSVELGRWINRDPLEENGGLSLYIFINNNPVNLIDKDGLAPFYSQARFLDAMGRAMENLYYEIENSVSKSVEDLAEYVKKKFDHWAENSKNRGSFQVQDRNKFGIGKYGELNWGFNAKITGSYCKTVVNGGAFGGIKIEIPIGMTGFSLVGGGAVSGQLVSRYDWGSRSMEREGIIKLSGYAGVRYGWGFIVLNTGAKVFVEAGGTISISYSLDREEFEEFKVGVYARAVVDVGMVNKVSRHEYKWTYGGDPGVF